MGSVLLENGVTSDFFNCILMKKIEVPPFSRFSNKSKLTPFFFILLSFLIIPEVKAQVWTTYTKANTAGLLANDYVQAIAIDGNTKWFGTWVGVSKCDGDGLDWKAYIKGPYPLISNIVQAIAIDGIGYKWFGTTLGVNKFDGSLGWDPYTTIEGLANNNVKAIAIDGSDKWFGTVGGISKYSGSWQSYTKDTPGVDINSDNILAIAIDGSGNKWFGTSVGVSKFDVAEHWITYTTADGLVNNSVQAIAIDGSGNKWFGTYGGVSKFDGNEWTPYTIATTSGGLVSNSVMAIAIDGSGNKWFGTQGGVSKFNGNEWISYTTAEGLVNNNVHAIAVDGGGNKWFGTDGGVSRLDDVSISGYIKNLSSAGISAVKVNLTGAETRTATTDADGNYQFNDLTPGGYTITPDTGVYIFIPSDINTGSLASDIEKQDFTGDRPPNVPYSPSPADGAGNVSTGTALSWTGGDPDVGDTVTYDIYFATSGPPSFKINQTSTTYAPFGLSNNTTYYWKIIAKDSYDASTAGSIWSFVTGGTPFTVYSIKGYITDSNGGISGITVNLTGEDTNSAATNLSGLYQFTGLEQGNYTVTPSSAIYLFTPAYLSYSPLSANRTGQNFTAVRISTETGSVEVRGGAKGYLRANEKAKIIMTPKTSGQVTIKIYSLRKKRVWKEEIYVTAGIKKEVECDMAQFASGTYIVHIKGAGYNEKKYIVVVR